MTPIAWALMLCTWGVIILVMSMCLRRLLGARTFTDDDTQEAGKPRQP